MRQKIFLVLFGLAASLFLIELVFCLSGHFYYKEWMRREYSSVETEGGEFTGVLSEQKVLPGDISSESIGYAQMGHDYLHCGKTELAKNYFEEAISVDPNNELLYLLVGHLYASLRQYDKALIMFRRLLRLNSYTSLRESLYRHLFWIYQQQNSPFRKNIIFL